MSPTSGLEFGYRGGFGNVLLSNRKAFIGIQKKLTPDEVTTIMYAINPASRLTAIEYYLTHKDLFENTRAIDDWIRKVYAEKPTIQTMDGCIQYETNSKELVEEYVKARGKY
jgi:hypothetical protein